MAERVGFEPTIPVKVCPLSRRIVSTTHAPLRVKNINFLATASKKLLQNPCAASGQHATANINPMVELWVIQQLHHRPHGAGFRVVCAINHALDARMHHRSGAHSARLNCNKQVAVRQTMVTEG